MPSVYIVCGIEYIVSTNTHYTVCWREFVDMILLFPKETLQNRFSNCARLIFLILQIYSLGLKKCILGQNRNKGTFFPGRNCQRLFGKRTSCLKELSLANEYIVVGNFDVLGTKFFYPWVGKLSILPPKSHQGMILQGINKTEKIFSKCWFWSSTFDGL